MALSAVDLMASPPITVGAKDSILDAKATLTRFDINAVPVMAGRRIVGVLNRQIADKALHHGLTDAPVSKVMESDVPSVAPDATIAEMMPLVRGRRRLLCVVDNGDLVGVVTRTEIYRAQIEGEDAVRPRQRRVAAHPSTNVADAAERTLPPGVLARIREIGRIAAEAGGLAYMVGGCVRDLLLARANLDIDIAVEGDARAVATAAVKRLGGKVQKHEPFLVAKITFDDGSKIDLATARVEHYAKPGRLPTVERSSIRKDLARRDFTINTLAIRIDPDAFGHLIDDLGGLGDLEHGIVRVIHPLSFVEDPTRIMRAVRFETRFDFRMDADTERFAREAVRAGYLMGLSPRRLRDELELILRDERPVRALVRMKEISALSAYHPRLLATARAKSYLFRVRLELENPEAILPGVIPDAVKTWLIALAATLGPGDDEAFLARVEMQGRPAQRLAERARAVEDLSRSLAHRARKTRSELARELGGWEPEALFALVARHDSPRVVERVREYWTTIRSAAPPVRGEDLMALGVARGRALGDALAALREVYLDGEATTREELIALARERFAPKATPAKAKKTHAK